MMDECQRAVIVGRDFDDVDNECDYIALHFLASFRSSALKY